MSVEELRHVLALQSSALQAARRAGLHTYAGAFYAGCAALEDVIKMLSPPAEPAEPAPAEERAAAE